MTAKEMEDFKRPNHPDFMDASELKKLEWSGIRGNSISQDVECWVKGEVVFFVTKAEMMTNAASFEIKYANYFGLSDVSMAEPVKK